MSKQHKKLDIRVLDRKGERQLDDVFLIADALALKLQETFGGWWRLEINLEEQEIHIARMQDFPIDPSMLRKAL